MASTKISAMTAATLPLTGTELIPVVQGSVNKQAPSSAFAQVPIAEVAFASLPVTPVVGQLANISNSNTAVWGANVAGGGANHVLARWNGANWTVVGK